MDWTPQHFTSQDLERPRVVVNTSPEGNQMLYHTTEGRGRQVQLRWAELDLDVEVEVDLLELMKEDERLNPQSGANEFGTEIPGEKLNPGVRFHEEIDHLAEGPLYDFRYPTEKAKRDRGEKLFGESVQVSGQKALLIFQVAPHSHNDKPVIVEITRSQLISRLLWAVKPQHAQALMEKLITHDPKRLVDLLEAVPKTNKGFRFGETKVEMDSEQLSSLLSLTSPRLRKRALQLAGHLPQSGGQSRGAQP